ncbi:MAG: type III pantothenate kinase [Desulfovibrionaceae bacterium]
MHDANWRAALVDVGNTRVKAALGGPEAILGSAGFDTRALRPGGAGQGGDAGSAARLEAELRRALEMTGWDGRAMPSVVSSVVPALDAPLAAVLTTVLGAPPRFVPGDLPVPLQNRYARPEEVGADRLVGAYGARRLHPEAERIIVVDFGTATTFDCLVGDAYLGGLICPGVLSSVRALTEETAKLPKATLEIDPDGLHMGESTLDSLNQGLVFGFAAMIEGLTPRLEQVMGGPALVLGTGGLAPAIARVCPTLAAVYKALVPEGLRRLALGE